MSEYPTAPPAPVPAPAAPPPWWALAVWGLVGALIGVGLMALLTVGPFLLAAAAVLALVAVAFRPLRSRAGGLAIAGLAAGPLVVAWLNRDGPGTVCVTTATSVSCTDEWSPWPFVAVGAVLVAVGVAAYRMRRR